MKQGSKIEEFLSFGDIKPLQTPRVQRDATTWVITTNAIITPSGKKCGRYILKDLTNDNKHYHNFRVGRRCLRAFGSCFEEQEEVFK